MKAGFLMRNTIRLAAVMALCLAILAGCTAASQDQPVKPPMPDKVDRYVDGIPVLDVYVVADKQTVDMALEDYLLGVLAGEMRNDWPIEALKAQAILARTFVLKFMTEKESKYGGADISTDIEEAQAYDAGSIDIHIEQAVEETRGLVLASDGQLPYTWFHAHSGGKTEYAKAGLNWNENEPPYTRVADGHESDAADESAREWSASFSQQAVAEAAKAQGVTIDTLESARVGESGESGRAVTLLLNGQQVNAPDFRIALGSTEMRSTFLTDIRVEDGELKMAGKGFGHGVGMSQWGAYALAEQGKRAEEIVLSYFRNVEVVRMY